jgi:hypothetical protein
MLKGLTAIGRSPFLRVYTITNALINVISQGIYAMVFWVAARGSVPLGESFVVLAAGAFVGSAVSPTFRSRRYHLLVLVPFFAYLVVAAVGTVSAVPWAVVVALAVAWAVSAPAGIALDTHVMASIPDEVQGRVQAALFLIGCTLYPFGALVSGAIASRWSLHAAFAMWGGVCGLVLVSAAVPALRLPGGGLPLSLGGALGAVGPPDQDGTGGGGSGLRAAPRPKRDLTLTICGTCLRHKPGST